MEQREILPLDFKGLNIVGFGKIMLHSEVRGNWIYEWVGLVDLQASGVRSMDAVDAVHP